MVLYLNISLIIFFFSRFTWVESAEVNISHLIYILDRLPTEERDVYLINCPESEQVIDEVLQEFSSKDKRHFKIRQFSGFSQSLSVRAFSVILMCSLGDYESIYVDGSNIIILVNSKMTLEQVETNGKGNRRFFIEDDKIKELVKIKSQFDEIILVEDVTDQSIANERTDLHGVELKIGYVTWGIMTQFDGKSFDGLMGKTFEAIRDLMNFTYTAVPSVDGFYGNKAEVVNGSTVGTPSNFTGLIGMLERREIDIAVADFFLDYGRAQYADFGGYVIEEPIHAFILKPGNNLLLDAYFSTFEIDIWIVVMCATVCLIIICFLLMFVSTRRKDDVEKDHRLTVLWRRSLEIISFAMRSLSTKDNFLMEYSRYKLTWRVLMLNFIVYGYFVFEVYNAELISYLTSKDIKLPIQRVDDILDNDMKLTLGKGGFVLNIIQNSPEEKYQRLWNEKVKDQPYGQVRLSKHEVLLEALKNEYVIIQNRNGAMNFVGRYPCLVSQLPVDPFAPTPVGMYLQKNSEITDLFRKSLNHLHEKGIINAYKKDYFRKSALNRKVCTDTNLKLGIQNTVFLFLWIGFGMFVSIVILVVEFIFTFTIRKQKTSSANSSP